ncbi:MAG TPA: hypothetical protein ENI12_05195, partial [Nitrospirae bacterium]|nr:hypothetical protein [Nitrospirota bacterium]
MADNITCPRCKTQQPESARSGGSARTDRCASCGLDFKAYAEHVRKKRAGREGRSVRCPYCKIEQPLRALCMKCGLDFKAYSDYLKRKKAGQDVQPPMPPARVVAPGEMAASAGADGAGQPMELEDLFKQTWEVFKKRWLTLIVLNVLYIAAIVVSILPVMVIVPLLSTDPDPITIAAVAGLYLIAVIAIAIVTLGSMFAAASAAIVMGSGSVESSGTITMTGSM